MTVMTLQSDRMLGRALLTLDITDVDGDLAQSCELPNNFGDALLEMVRVSASSFATVAATPHLLGVTAVIAHTAPVDRSDIVGQSNWIAIAGTAAAATAVAASIEPYRPVLWRVGESLRISAAELDTNAAPTVDYVVQARVTRLRVS